MKKILALVLAAVMLMGLVACGQSSAPAATTAAPAATEAAPAAPAATEAATEPATEVSNYGGLTVTLMNSKPEITDAVKAMAQTWGDAHGVNFEIYETSNPNDTLTQKYQSGDAPVIGIVDTVNVLDFATEYMLPLDGEEWLDYTSMAYSVDGKVYGFPLTVESHCIVVNKTAVEANLGREFNPDDYKSIDAFEALLAEVRANGIENPVVILPDVWSMCGQDFYHFYYYQDGTADGAFQLCDDIKAGKDVFDDPVFTDHMHLMVDVMKEYNINKADPLNADHDMSILELVEGNACFLLNGSWTAAELLKLEATDEFLMMPYPTNNEAVAGKAHAAPTKYIVIDNSNATAEQQAAAKEFLNYLVMDDAGQKALVNDCGIVVGFTNNPYVPADDVNSALMGYIAAGKTFSYVPFSFPSDYRNTIAPTIQKIMTDEGATVRDLADILNEYWTNNAPKGR